MHKVLIVEDEDIIRKGLIFMVDWLKVDCIVVGEASNGVKGVEMIEKHRPDIVIADIRMPFMDGLRMFEETIDEYGYKGIILTSYGEFDYAKKAISLGVEEYLLKPVDFEKLYEIIEKISRKIKKEEKIESYIESIEDINMYEDILDIRHYELIDNKTDYVKNMIDYIEENYQEKISLKDLSDDYNLSKVYLNNKFKEETSYTFNDFLNRYRVLRAMEFLKNGDLKMYEIAELVGFKDYKYFNHVFNKYVKMSPTEFLNSI